MREPYERIAVALTEIRKAKADLSPSTTSWAFADSAEADLEKAYQRARPVTVDSEAVGEVEIPAIEGDR